MIPTHMNTNATKEKIINVEINSRLGTGHSSPPRSAPPLSGHTPFLLCSQRASPDQHVWMAGAGVKVQAFQASILRLRQEDQKF